MWARAQRAWLVAFWLAIAAFNFAGLDTAIGDGDESVHAEILRAMLRSGDFLHMRWYGAVLWERPQLMYWLAAPFAAVIPDEIGVRLCAALLSFATLIVVWRIAMQQWGRRSVAATAVLLLAGAPSFHDYTRRLMSEAPFVFALTVALWGVLHASEDRRGLKLAAFGLGAATAVKSFAAVIPALALSPWLWRALRAQTDRRSVFVAVGIALALAVPFYVIGLMLAPRQFIDEHLLFHLVQRAQGGFVGMGGGTLAYLRWIPRADGPFVSAWLLVGSLAACVLGIRQRAFAILGSYAVLVFIGMSCLGTRLPHYVLPIYPAAALAAAGGCGAIAERFEKLRRPPWAALAPALALAVLLVSRQFPGARDALFERPYGKLFGLKAKTLSRPEQPVYAYEWYGLSLGYYAQRRLVLLTAQPKRFAAIDFAQGAIHRAGVAALVPPLPASPGSQILIAGHVDDLTHASWLRVGEVLSAVPPFFLVRGTVLALH